MTIADHIGLGLGLGLVTALGGPDLRNGGPSEWRTQIGAPTLQTTDDRQTDGPSMTYSEHELEFTFAKNHVHCSYSFVKALAKCELYRHIVDCTITS